MNRDGKTAKVSMPSPSEATLGPPAGEPAAEGNPKVTPEAFALALLIASSLQIMENLLPRFPLFPWMRIGISYVVILPFLLQYGPRAAFALFLARNVISILYGGQPLTTFLIGSGSGAVAFLGLGAPVAWAHRRGWLGILGASILLATAFNLAQLAAVNVALIRHAGFYFQTGPILAWSLISGAAVALLIRFSHGELTELFSSAPAKPDEKSGSGGNVSLPGAPNPSHAGPIKPSIKPSIAPSPISPFLLGLAALILLFAFPDLRVQLPALAVLLILVRDRIRMLVNAWPFFFYLAWLHLFHTSGAYIVGEWITREGAGNFAVYAVRLADLILLGRWLSARFPWQWAGRSRSPYLQGFLLTLPLLPDMFAPSLVLGKDILRALAAGKRSGALAPAFAAWKGRMAEAAESTRAGRTVPEKHILSSGETRRPVPMRHRPSKE